MKMSLRSMRTAWRIGLTRLDPQGHQDRVGVGRLDGPGDGGPAPALKRTLRRIRWTLSPTRLKTSTHCSSKLSVQPPRPMPPRATAIGAQERPVELVRLDLGVEVLVLLVELEQALVDLGPGDDLVEVLVLRRLLSDGRERTQRKCQEARQEVGAWVSSKGGECV